MAATSAKASTAWGEATVLDQLVVQQRAGERRFAVVVQLLEGPKGDRLVRFAYTTDGIARRGPVTLRERDVDRMRAALGEHPELRAILGMGGA
jgi:hypothetical protein